MTRDEGQRLVDLDNDIRPAGVFCGVPQLEGKPQQLSGAVLVHGSTVGACVEEQRRDAGAGLRQRADKVAIISYRSSLWRS